MSVEQVITELVNAGDLIRSLAKIIVDLRARVSELEQDKADRLVAGQETK